MCPADRVDIISHALLYYGIKTKQNYVRVIASMNCIYYKKKTFKSYYYYYSMIASLLTNRWRKASALNTIARQSLRTPSKSLPSML